MREHIQVQYMMHAMKKELFWAAELARAGATSIEQSGLYESSNGETLKVMNAAYKEGSATPTNSSPKCGNVGEMAFPGITW